MVADPVLAAAARLAAAREVTLLAHVQPDADSLGSALALGIALHRRGARVWVSFASPDEVPEALRPLDVHRLVVPSWQVPLAPELLVACDAAEPSRLGSLADRLESAGTTIMIDHHVSNPGFGDVQVLVPEVEATVVLAHRVLVAMGEPVDVDIARCLYAGLATDTTNFRSAGAAAHRLAAELIDTGLDPEPLVRSIMDTHSFGWLTPLGAALQRSVLEPGAADGLGFVYTVLPAATARGFRSGEIDGVVGRDPGHGRGRGRGRPQGGGRAAVERLVAVEGPRRRGGGGGPDGRRRAPGGRRLHLRRGPRQRAGRAAGCARAGGRPAGGRLRPRYGAGVSETRAFLTAFLRRPSTMGAVAPSSAGLAAILASVVPTGGIPVVIELGPGTGAVSTVIADRLPVGARHLAVELDADMVALPATHPSRAGGGAR